MMCFRTHQMDTVTYW